MASKYHLFSFFMCLIFPFMGEAKEHFGYNCLKKLTQRESSEKVVVLTFDDGPSKSTTPEVLDILNREGIKATFFVLGKNVKANPEIILSLKENGHEIANHSYSHPTLSSKSTSSITQELVRTNKELAKLDVHPKWFRPPYGAYNSTVKKVAFENNMHSILWSSDPQDWKRPGAEKLKKRILADLDPGEVILLHDIHQSTVDALPEIIDALKDRGYTFVTLSEWYDQLQGANPLQQTLCM